MKTKLLIILSLIFALDAEAGSATWNLNPTNGDWNTATNWMPNTVPNSPTDIATFDVSNVTAVSLSADTTVDEVVFNSGAIAFTITVPVRRTLTFAGQGVTNNSGVVQNFATEVNGGKIGTIIFTNEATAGDASIFTAGADLKAGEDSFIKFFGSSNAGNSTFLIGGGGTTADDDIYGSTLLFDENSTAGNATIVAKSGAGEVDFFGSSTAGNASIILEGPSATTFYGGFGYFKGSSTADHSTIQLGGTAGYPVNADLGAFLGFLDGSSAGNALITIEGATGDGGAGGTVSFGGHGMSLANATIIANGTDFQDATGGEIHFAGAADNGDATIIINGGETAGGLCNFLVDTAGRARLEVFGNGLINVFPTVQVGSIEGDGVITVGSFVQPLLQIGSNNLSTTFSGLIQDGVKPGPIEKNGTGTLTLSGANTYTGATAVSGGTLLVSNVTGSGTGSGPVSVKAGTLGGSGIISGAVTVGTNTGVQAFLAPSKGRKKPATLAIQGALILNDDSTYIYKLDTKHRVSDQILANGVTIDNGAKFSLRPSGTTQLRLGQVFTVINNTAASAISGRFHNLADGAIVNVNGNNLQASYSGGDGNDLTLTVVP
jgi:autotransporter-associated beta strand protein